MLQRILRTRRHAYDRLDAALMTWLDPRVMVTAFANIGALERCPLKNTPQGLRAELKRKTARPEGG